MKKFRTLFACTLLFALLLSATGCAATKSKEDGFFGNLFPSNGDVDADVAGTPNAPQEGDQDAGEEDEGSLPEDEGSLPEQVENPFIKTEEQNVSTFSADVDTASYTFFRKLVNSGYRVKDLAHLGQSFRVEEFINYFAYDTAAPAEGELFGVERDIIPCPWNEETLLMRLTLQAQTSVPSEGNNLVFLIDVSGSMASEDKLQLLKRTFSYLVDQLTERDVISIVTYSGREQVVLEGCRGNLSAEIMAAINSLNASGATNGEAGLTRAYQLAEAYRIEGGNNRIIMAYDGDLNVGISSASDLKAYVEGMRDRGVYLSILGFGSGNYRDANMEALADNGNGVYYYIDGESEAEKVFGTDLLGTLYTVAEDVKLQLTFDPNFVESYRLIGYENRLLAPEDFEDDTKDAGEVGAGHRVTVCYELKPTENALTSDAALATAEDAVWMSLAVRYKNPGEEISRLNEYTVGLADFEATPDEDLAFLSCLIRTVMLLRGSQYAQGVTYASLYEELCGMDLSAYPEREEFRTLIGKLVDSAEQ